MAQYSESLRAARSGDRIPLRASFSASAAHPATYTIGVGLVPGVKRPGRGVDHPAPSRAEVNYRERDIPLLPIWVLVASYSVNIIFYLPLFCS
jgi:hypothetical protein